MNAKKVSLAKVAKEKEKKSLIKFFSDVKSELKQVSWTKKDELKTYTKVVLGSTFVFGFLIYIFDLVIQGVLHFVNFFSKFISG